MQTGLWSVADEMNIPRGYQGNVTLSDGSVFTVGGSWSGGAWTNRDAEIWTESSGWQLLPNIKGDDFYTANDVAGDSFQSFTGLTTIYGCGLLLMATCFIPVQVNRCTG